ncbi:MAG TPA: class F sortase [Streptosporangiaceae bacterium]|nr:class F sortase [Streptosporangiaceae bacterium]
MKFSRPGRRRTRKLAGALVIVGFGLAGCGGTAAPGSAPATRTSSAPAAPAAGGQAETLGRSLPVKLDIPKIGVHAPVSTLGLKSDGTIEEPPLSKPNLTGWYRLGPTPGEKGPAVIAGHVDAHGGPAVFYRLKQLHRGDTVTVTRKDGSVVTFQIDAIQQVPKDAFPTKKVYGDIGFPGVRLITCGGGFDRRTGHYVDNVIAYGHMVASRA